MRFLLPRDVWQALLTSGAVRSYRTGEVLMRQGDPGSHVFILAAGRVKIARVDSEGNELLLAVRGVGDIVGELAVLGGGLRSATVTALDAELLGHLLLGSLHSDLVLRLLRRGETERLTATLHELITTLLPAEPPNYYNT